MRKKHSQYERLKKRWVKRHQELQDRLISTHGEAAHWIGSNAKQLAVGGAAGLMLLHAATPSTTLPPRSVSAQELPQEPAPTPDKSAFFMTDLHQYVPHTVEPLSKQQKQAIGGVLSQYFGLDVQPSLNGIELNSAYGYIGEEQHLARYPGDTMGSHFDNQNDARLYWSSGMAPGLGAWGYFAPSQAQMTGEDKMREKYYIAVQTFLAPGYLDHVGEYNDFFRYRKMLVVNPDNGKALVAVIGDAGPASWTGKQLGGSPEVMSYLERVDGAQKGPVLYFFVNDPENKVPLGPINVQ